MFAIPLLFHPRGPWYLARIKLGMFQVAILAVAILPCAISTAQGSGRRISLREAVALAARNSPTLAIAVADVAIADAKSVAAGGIDDFVWNGSASWNTSRVDYVSGTPVQQTMGDDILFSTSLTRSLPTGGTVGLQVSTDTGRGTYLTDVGFGPQTSTATYQSPSITLFGSHPLLRGAGEAIARAQRRRAAVSRSVANLERDAAAESLVHKVVSAYWEMRYAAEELDVLEALTESAREQLKAVRAAISVEKQPPSASAEVEVAVAFRQDSALAAQQAWRAQSAELSRLLGIDLDPQAPWTASDEPSADVSGASFDVALAAAMDHNPELAAVRAKGRAAAIEVEVDENGTLPTVDLAVSGDLLGTSDSTGSALSQLGAFRTFDVQAGLVFQQALGRHTAIGALEAGQQQLHRARLVEADIASQIRSTVVREIGAVDAARRRIAVLAGTTDMATLDLSAERARFEVGRATNFDVLRRQEELAQAKLHLLRARIDYLEAAAGIEALTGEILAHYGVTVQ
jgi:outer membrane protein TolC